MLVSGSVVSKMGGSPLRSNNSLPIPIRSKSQRNGFATKKRSEGKGVDIQSDIYIYIYTNIK